MVVAIATHLREKVYNMKILAVVATILAAVCIFLYNMYNLSQKRIIALESEKNSLNEIIEEYKQNEIQANKRIEELKATISVDKTSLDWYHTRIPAPVLDKLRKNKN